MSKYFENASKYWQLKRSEVGPIARDIASAIYESEKGAPSYTNVIITLRDLCTNHTNHLGINETNYDCVLEALKPVADPNRRGEISNVTSTSSAVEDYVRKLRNFRDRLHRREGLIEKDDFECCSPLPLSRGPSANGDRVGFVYALLNLPKAEETLLATLSNWPTDSSLDSDELRCVEYMWKNFDDLSDRVQAFVLENFAYVLEKAIIRRCKEALETNGSGTDLSEFRTRNERALYCIKSIIYSLFLYSGCSLKLLRLLKIFE